LIVKYTWTEENLFGEVAVQHEQDQLDGRDQEEADAQAEEEEQDDEVFPLPTNNHQVLAVLQALFVWPSVHKWSNYMLSNSEAAMY